MRVSWKWLNELVEINISPEELSEKMTRSGVAVEGIERLQKGVSGVVVGLITEVKAHTGADKLVVCTINTGSAKDWTIVSGAPNLAAGLRVPVALPGSSLPGGKRIETTTFRGVESEGMLCSAGELGLEVDKLPTDQKDGIYILTGDVPLGADIVEVLGLDDIILELELTPNRSDCLAMLNVAREVAALTGGKLSLPTITKSEQGGPAATKATVEIAEPGLCKRYVARIIEDVKIQKSPMWLQHRLLAAGVRPINNIVDITNYVMMEMGQPLHAFDYDMLTDNKIIVRKPQAGEELITLDGQKRLLNSEMLIIADGAKPVALAGVMGGLETEVTDKTKTILLESAHFNPVSIRRTAQALNMRSEASLRFEKNVDIDKANLVADRAVQLMQLLGAGTPVPGHIDCYPETTARYPLALRLVRVNQVLGTSLSASQIEEILHALQIDIVKKDTNGWSIVPPSYRGDLEKEIDIIEEVARLHGYDEIPTTLPQGDTTQGMRSREQQLRHRIYDLMIAQGLFEVITYSFINPRHLDWLGVSADDDLRKTVNVKNPLSEEQGIMRTTIIPGLLDTVMKNINKRNKNLKLFELGKIYTQGGFPSSTVLPEEKLVLGAAVTGRKEKTWAYGEEEYNFYYLKGVIENILTNLGIADYSFKQINTISWFHPGRTAQLIIGDREAGTLGEINPLVLDKYGIDQRVVAMQLDLELVIALAQDRPIYQAIARYPALSRDLAVVVPEKIAADKIAGIIARVGENLLRQIRMFDLYRGKQVMEGYKSLAYSLTWQADDRTLTDEEVNALHQEIEVALSRELGADLRR